MAARVFISAGTYPTPQQATALEALFNALTAAGLDPRQMNKNEWSSEQPLRAIRKVIDECHGLVLVAFTRFHVLAGTERKEQGEVAINGARMPTVWNQIEAAMAFVRGVPFLVVAEKGLRDDGLIEARYDWNVYWTDFSEADFRSEKFAGWVKSWKEAVIRHAELGTRQEDLKDPGELTLGDLLRLITEAIRLVGAGDNGRRSCGCDFSSSVSHWRWEMAMGMRLIQPSNMART